VWHARQPERWEFIRGQPRRMVPGSMPHTIIKGNVLLDDLGRLRKAAV
jgi:hypothetical protein